MDGRTTKLAGLTLALAVALAAGPAANARPPAPSQPDAATVELLDCDRARAARETTFRGTMVQQPGGTSMRMRFRLLERVARGRWRPVRAPGLGVWRESRPGIERFVYSQRVAGLAPATAYRVRVSFRWHDAAGRRLAAAERRSRPCRQPGRLANLRARGLTVEPGPTADTARYRVRLVNAGRVPARDVRVRLVVDGAEVDLLPVGGLRRGERRVLRMIGPACRGRAELALDPGDAIRETREDDNVAVLDCAAADAVPAAGETG